MADYDIGAAFAEIEDYLLESMKRNMQRHIGEEKQLEINWSQWQAEMLKGLKRFEAENKQHFGQIFPKINARIEELIELAHNTGESEQEKEILTAIRKGYKPPHDSKPLTGEFLRLNQDKMRALISETTNSMEKAEYAALRMANDQYRKIIFNAQTFYNSGAGTLWQAVDMASKNFLRAGLNCVEYKNGVRMNIASYAEMVLRTSNTRAYLHGEAVKREQYSIHTVLVNRHGAACPKCIKWQGRVFIDDVWGTGTSYEAQTKGYPLLSTAIEGGLYHPNCKDGHTTYFEGVSRKPAPPSAEQRVEQVRRYNLQQQQRYNERNIRKYKRLYEGAFDDTDAAEYAAKLQTWQQVNEELITQNPKILRRAPERERLYDFLAPLPESADSSYRVNPVVRRTVSATEKTTTLSYRAQYERAVAVAMGVPQKPAVKVKVRTVSGKAKNIPVKVKPKPVAVKKVEVRKTPVTETVNTKVKVSVKPKPEVKAEKTFTRFNPKQTPKNIPASVKATKTYTRFKPKTTNIPMGNEIEKTFERIEKNFEKPVIPQKRTVKVLGSLKKSSIPHKIVKIDSAKHLVITNHTQLKALQDKAALRKSMSEVDRLKAQAAELRRKAQELADKASAAKAKATAANKNVSAIAQKKNAADDEIKRIKATIAELEKQEKQAIAEYNTLMADGETQRTLALRKIRGQSWVQSINVNGADYTSEMFQIFEKATPEELKFWEKYGSIVKGDFHYVNYDDFHGAHYSPRYDDRMVHLDMLNNDDRNKVIGEKFNNRCFFHETGHMFDDLLLSSPEYTGRTRPAGNRPLPQIIDMLPDFERKLEEDYIDYVNRLLNLQTPLTSAQDINLLNARQVQRLNDDMLGRLDAKNRWSNPLPDDAQGLCIRASVSDIVEGLTGGIVGGQKNYHFGHNKYDRATGAIIKDYWNAPGRYRALAKEAFAEFMEAKMEKGEWLEIIKEYFPTAYQYFDDCINSLV